MLVEHWASSIIIASRETRDARTYGRQQEIGPILYAGCKIRGLMRELEHLAEQLKLIVTLDD